MYSGLGRSRSASIALAYLMRFYTGGLTLREALNLIRTKRSSVCPNPGFYQQLKLWDIIKYNWEERDLYPEYRYWRMATSAGIISCTSSQAPLLILVNCSKYGGHSLFLGRRSMRRNMKNFMEPFPLSRPPDSPGDEVRWWETPTDSYYRCARCKCPLAPARTTFSLSAAHNTFDRCSHVFLCAPMTWMENQINPSEPGGQLYCPNCSDLSSVGEYCWLGVQCQFCGEIVAPGVALLMDSVQFKRVSEGSYDDNEIGLSLEELSQTMEHHEEGESQLTAVEEVSSEIVPFRRSQQNETQQSGVHGISAQILPNQGSSQRSTSERNEIPRSIPRTPTRNRIIPNPNHLPLISSPLRLSWTLSETSSSNGSQSADSQDSQSAEQRISSEARPFNDINSSEYWTSMELAEEHIPYEMQSELPSDP